MSEVIKCSMDNLFTMADWVSIRRAWMSRDKLKEDFEIEKAVVFTNDKRSWRCRVSCVTKEIYWGYEISHGELFHGGNFCCGSDFDNYDRCKTKIFSFLQLTPPANEELDIFSVMPK